MHYCHGSKKQINIHFIGHFIASFVCDYEYQKFKFLKN